MASAAMQLQRELLETILEEKSERMRDVDDIISTLTNLRQENQELRKRLLECEDMLQGHQVGSHPSDRRMSGETARSSQPGDDLQDLRRRVEDLEMMAKAKKSGVVGISSMEPQASSRNEEHVAGSDCDEQEAQAMTEADADKGDVKNYELRESMWDAAILIGMPGMGKFGSVHSSILVLVNIFIQVVFCLLAFTNFTDQDIDGDTVVAVREWRLSTAHNYQHVDVQSSKALVTRVCGEDEALYLADGQLQMYQDIIQYLPHLDATLAGEWDQGLRESFNGEVMCLLSLACFTMSLLRELHQIWDGFKAFWYIKRGRWTSIAADGTFHKMATCRFVLYCILTCIRVTLVFCLAYVGTFFLVYDVGVEDLLLNAVALQFILDVDELIFDALAPETTKLFMSRIEPLHVPHSPLRLKGMDVKTVVMTILVPTSVFTVFAAVLLPMVDEVEDVNKEMCGGVRAFAYHSSATGFIAIAATQTDDKPPTTIFDMMQEMAKEIVRSVVLESEPLPASAADANTTGEFIGIDDMASWGTLDFAAVVERVNPDCQDLWDSHEGIFKQVRWLLNFNFTKDGLTNPYASCADLKPFCTTLSDPPGGVTWPAMTRLICPQTCGCSEATGLYGYMPIAEQGCSTQCTQQWSDGEGDFDLTADATLCVDQTPQALQATDFWTIWTHESWTTGISFPITIGNSSALSGTHDLYTDGCSAVPTLSAVNMIASDIYLDTNWEMICLGGDGRDTANEYDHKPLVAICPDACGCRPDPTVRSIFLQQVILKTILEQQYQAMSCPSSCVTVDEIQCQNYPSWVCDQNNDASDNVMDYVFVDSDKLNTDWMENCERGEGYRFSILEVVRGCYNCISDPVWACDLTTTAIQEYNPSSPNMPADIFVYDAGRNGTVERAPGAAWPYVYNFCKLGVLEATNVNATARQEYYWQIAEMCYRKYCEQTDTCTRCLKDPSNPTPLNTKDWTFDCTEPPQNQAPP